jgi:STE24 endopeptidase
MPQTLLSMIILLLTTHSPAHARLQTAQQDSSSVAAAVAVQASQDAVPVPQPSEKAMRYYRSGNLLWVIDTAWGMIVPILLLVTGLSARMRNRARKWGRKWFFALGIYWILFLVLVFLINLPLSYYEEFVRQHAYDLSNQTFAKWCSDSLKSLIIGGIAGILLLWIPYLLLKRSPKRWWLYCSIVAVPVIFIVMVISPIWISPLFNRFGPMKDKSLESSILALGEKAGIEGSRVYEVNKSVDTNAVNAYVTGFLGTKRIVLWDTIIQKLNRKELLFVMGHEMGHYVLGHTWKLVLFLSILILITLYAAYRAAGGILSRFRQQFGFDQLSDIASLPLLLLLLNLFSFIVSPIDLWYGRHIEHEADRFGLEITQDNHDAATAFVKLQQENLGNPRPGLLYKIWRADHPVLGDRIDFCNRYRPWQTGEKMKYERYFKK